MLWAPAVQEEASKRKHRGQKLFALQAKTTFGHRKSGKHERIRLPFKRGRIATRLTAVSPAGSVGASASQRCPPDTRTAMTERQLTAHTTRYSWQLKDLSFWVRNTKESVIPFKKRKRIAAAVYTASQWQGVWERLIARPVAFAMTRGTDYRHILLHNKKGLLIRLFGIKSNIR